MNIKQLQEFIRSFREVSSWEIRRWRKKSYQRYLIFDRIESQRMVESEKFIVTFYLEQKWEGQKVLGESTVSFAGGEDYRGRLTSALEMAALVKNPVFRLPEKGLIYDPIQTVDPDIREQPLIYLDRIQEDLQGEPLERVKRSSAEVFLEDKELFLINSNGLEQEASFTEILVDFVLLAEKGARLDGESQGTRRARFYKDLRMAEIVRQYGQYAREAQEARLPSSGRYPVVFGGEALDTLFSFFIQHASGPACFQNWSQLTLGEPVIHDLRGEALSLSSNPSLPGGLESRPFDSNGLPLRPVKVIKDNLFKTRLNNKRYADYLKEEATGELSNVEVGPGSHSLVSFAADGPGYYLCRFSTFEPNPITGAFSGEIRTGYFLEGGRKTPIKGGSVSGTMQKAFRQAYFSKEIIQRESFLGPEAVKIDRLDITGQ
jgi:PmbA protein